MSYVDAIIDRKRDKIHVVERVGGERIYKDYPANYVLYYDDPRGNYKTIYGSPVTKFHTNSGKEFQKEIRSHTNKRIWESDINPVFRCLADNYINAEPPKIHTAFLDIETDFDQVRGFAPTSDPFNKITAITVYMDWADRLITLAIPPRSMSMDVANQIASRHGDCFIFDNEIDLLDTFLSIIDDADVLSGWNSETYDIPYIVGRIIKVMSRNDTRRLCLWDQFPSPREFERYGAKQITYDLVGRVHVDYMQLYRNYTYEERHSYSLDAIGEYELDERKTAYEGTLDQLYNRDFDLFLEYNRQDVRLLAKLDKKLKFLDLANSIAHDNTVLLPTIMGAVATTEQAIINESHRLGLIVPNRKKRVDHGEDDVGDKAAGAYVAYPKVGMHKWIGAIDINSLYPSVIRALNMGLETIVGQIRPTMTEQYIKEKMEDKVINGKKVKGCSFAAAWEGLFGSLEYTSVMNLEHDTQVTIDWEDTGKSDTMSAADCWHLIFDGGQPWVLSANGTIFKYDKKGVIPGLLERWYSERKSLQKQGKSISEIESGIEVSDAMIEEIQKLLGGKITNA